MPDDLSGPAPAPAANGTASLAFVLLVLRYGGLGAIGASSKGGTR